MPRTRTAAPVGSWRSAERSAWVRFTVAWVLFLAALMAAFLTVGELDAAALLEGHARLPAAATSIALLASDIFLPIPSSIAMTLNGTLFRFLPGAAISLAGLLAGAFAGYWIARLVGLPVLRAVGGARSIPSVRPFFERYGVLAVVLSRPIPLIAETVTCMAGVAGMRFGPFFAAQAAGALPLALGYAWVGSAATERRSAFLALSFAVFVPSLLWAIWWATRRSRQTGIDKETL